MFWSSCRRRTRTDGSTFNHISYGESLDGLVFVCAARAVGASYRFDMASTFLVTPTIQVSPISAGSQRGLVVNQDQGLKSNILGRSLLDHS